MYLDIKNTFEFNYNFPTPSLSHPHILRNIVAVSSIYYCSAYCDGTGYVRSCFLHVQRVQRAQCGPPLPSSVDWTALIGSKELQQVYPRPSPRNCLQHYCLGFLPNFSLE